MVYRVTEGIESYRENIELQKVYRVTEGIYSYTGFRDLQTTEGI